MSSAALAADRRPSGWLARAIIAGFVALGVSTVVLVMASAAAGAIGELYRDSNVITQWMFGLTHNPVVELGRGRLFVSLAVHLVVGMFWAIVYALVYQPRNRHYPDWLAGVQFSMIPFVFSLVIFLPATGGGFAGTDLGAGPLPILGNLILHIIYGATLGTLYGADADRADTRGKTEAQVAHQMLTLGRAESSAARGILVGAALGALAGVGLAYVLPFSTVEQLVSNWPLAMGVTGALAGGAVGALIGSMVGLTDPEAPAISGPAALSNEPQPVAAALIPLGVILVVACLIVTIGSALLTVGDTHIFGRERGYNQAIALGLGILTVVSLGAAWLSRGGERPDEPRH